MKNIILLLILSSQLILSQTKKETINWLNINLEAYGDNSIMGTYQIELKNDSDYGEYLLFTKKNWNPLLEKNTYDYYSFLPKVISNIILSGKDRTNNTLDIFIISNTKGIYIPEKEELISEFGIHMKNGNNEMTKRIQKGLLHLLELLGNKIETQKELFKN